MTLELTEGMKVDWEELAEELGTLTEFAEIGGTSSGISALELILGEEFFQQAVNHHLSCKPGFELARSVLMCIRSWTAMKYCYEIYRSTSDSEEKRSVVDLLRFISDRRILEWIPEFLADPDEGVQNAGINLIDQLLFWRILHDDDVRLILEAALHHSNAYVRKQTKWMLEIED